MKNNLFTFKRQLLIAAILCTGTSLFAQTEKIINVSETKTVSTLLTANDLATVTKLIVTTSNGAVMDVSDYNFIYQNMPKLEELDLLGDNNSTFCAGLRVSNDFTNTTIKKLTFPPKTANIGTFSGCGLQGVVEFPSTISNFVQIENKFLDCKGITGFAFPNGHPTMSTSPDGKVLFAEVPSGTYVNSVLVTPGKRLCLYLASNLATSYTMPEGVVSIGLSAFGYNAYLEEIAFSSTMIDIFSQNGNVRTDVIAPQTPKLRAFRVAAGNVRFDATENGFLIDKNSSAVILVPAANKDENIVIDGSKVKKFTALLNFFPHIKSIVFTEGFEEINGNIFKPGMDGNNVLVMQLEYVEFPSTLKSIAGEVFHGCKKIQQFIFKGLTPPDVAGNSVFREANGVDVRIGVPAAAVNDYKASKIIAAVYANGQGFTVDQITTYKNITYDAAIGAQNVSIPGFQVKVTAGEGPDGKSFSGWISDPAGVAFVNANAATTYFTMPATDVTIRALFAVTSPYTIIGATISTSGSAAVGSSVNIETGSVKIADGNTHYFQKWQINKGEENGLVIVNPNAVATSFTMVDGEVEIEAIYKAAYMVNVNGGNAAELEYFEGDVVTITASNRPNQTFDKWTSTTPGVTFADETAKTTTFVMPASVVDVRANFKTDTAIEAVNTFQSTNYTIYNTVGKIVAQGIHEGEGLPNVQLPKGIYLVKTGDTVVKFIRQ
jgi:hypothetical protein